jgi:hypothetical protein
MKNQDLDMDIVDSKPNSKLTLVFEFEKEKYELEKPLRLNLYEEGIWYKKVQSVMKEELFKRISDYEFIYFFSLPLKPKIRVNKNATFDLVEGGNDLWLVSKAKGKINKRETKRLMNLYKYLEYASDIKIFAKLKITGYDIREYIMFIKLWEDKNEN